MAVCTVTAGVHAGIPQHPYAAGSNTGGGCTVVYDTNTGGGCYPGIAVSDMIGPVQTLALRVWHSS